MKRTGECKNCGRCCQQIAFVQDGYSEELKEFLTARFKRVDVTNPGPNTYVFMATHECEQLRYRKNGTTFCAVHDSKPAMCRKYPETSGMRLMGCAYEFVETEGSDGENT